MLGTRRYLAVVLLLLILSLASAAGLFERWELIAYDSWFALRGSREPGVPVVVVEIDDTSIQEIGPFPWPRRTHALLLEKLEGAAVVGWDLLFDAPGGESQDEALAAAFGVAAPRQVLASQLSFAREGDTWMQQLQQPVPLLAASSYSTGFINMPTDLDNVVRGVMPADLNTFGRPYPSLGLAVSMAFLGLSVEDLHLVDRGLAAGSLRVPWRPGDRTLISFWGPARTFPTYRYSDVLKGTVDPAAFRDRIVLVGPTSALSKDEFPTPFTRGNLVLSGALPSPGVEIHASAVATMLSASYLLRAPWWLNQLVMILAGLATMLVTRRLRPWLGLALVLLLGVALALLAYGLWSMSKFWINFSTPVLAVALTYGLVTLTNFIEAEINRRHVQELFGRYVPPQVVDQLVKNPDMVHLGGSTREVTVLFSDIRGFTSYSEGLAPEEVVSRLNQYFGAMTEVIFRYGGTLDKYLGDGLMAVFGAPLPVTDHARRALSASLEMLARLEDLNHTWVERGEKSFQIGIGLNSGPVLVGNIGSPLRLEYTAIGEDVNLASRLESLNKEWKTSIILSERTLTCLGGELPAGVVLEELGQVNVRGLAQPVCIYTARFHEQTAQEHTAAPGN